MAYSELVKNFNRIRDYMREFYIYGFKSREEYTKKSARSYDDERRRLASWLGDYMQFRQTSDGRNVFLTIDSRKSLHNPLYKAWKTKSFTDGEITLYFILMDIFAGNKHALSIAQIMARIDNYLKCFEHPKVFDESTVRKKLKEYAKEGILITEKQGKLLCYKLSQDTEHYSSEVLDFFSETAPCGVIGSFLLDREEQSKNCFAFKHHYITSALDSEIVCQLFDAMRRKCDVLIETTNRKTGRIVFREVVPLKIMISVQSGRQYLMAYSAEVKRITSFRTDNIISVKSGKSCGTFDELRAKLADMKQYMWGVSTQSRSGGRKESVEFTVCYGKYEKHIHQRLEREKRCGTVEKVDEHTSRFSAEVYDSSELIPWIRTFIGRITEIHFSNQVLDAQFKHDIEMMCRIYETEGGDRK